MHSIKELGNKRILHSRRNQPFSNPRWLYTNAKKKVHILAMGDVGATALIGLKLLGAEVISEIGIYDIHESVLKRYEFELNQVIFPNHTPKLPTVKILTADTLFDCDVFMFCATKGVAGLDSTVKDVRMAQYEANKEIISHYALLARNSGFDGLFAVISDPVEPLCRCAFLASNTNYLGQFDDNGLHPEQIQGYGMGVMYARAAYYSAQSKLLSHFQKSGRVFGQHGKGLVVADSMEHYNDTLSKQLTQLAIDANMQLRSAGFKPYIAPALSSAALSIIATIRGEFHDASIPINEIYFGVRSKTTKEGLVIENTPIPDTLFDRLSKSYHELEELT